MIQLLCSSETLKAMAEVPSIDSQIKNTPPDRDEVKNSSPKNEVKNITPERDEVENILPNASEIENIIEPQPEGSDKLDSNSSATKILKIPHQWPKLLSDFFKKMNLIQTQKIFDTELLVVPSEVYNSAEVPISELLKGFQDLVTSSDPESTTTNYETFKENSSKRMKIFNSNNLAFPKTIKELDQDIDKFISQKKAKIVLSNQKEFIEKPSAQGLSCARVNVKKINPNLHIKTSVAHNREGPLIRSLGSSRNDDKNVHQLAGTWSHQDLNSHSAEQIDVVGRLGIIEDHLNLVYADTELKNWKPIDRIRAVEAKIMQLERLLPNWASQHFNQPNRKFPNSPPPNYPIKDSRGRIFLNSEPRSND